LNKDNSIKVIDKTELLIDTIWKHMSIENCEHCKKLLMESFDKWK